MSLYFTLALLTCFALARGASEEACGGKYSSWTHYKGYCYLFPYSSIGTHSWFEARDHCNQLGAHLLSVHSAEENDFINTILGNVFGGYFNDLWIGLNAVDDASHLQWTDASEVNFMNLRDDPRDVVDSPKKCLGINRINKPIKWQGYYCNNKLSYVCKRQDGVKPSTITPPPTTITPGNCPSGWRKIGSNCVRVFGANPADRGNWTESLKSCRGEGGTLVTVNNEREQVELTSLLIDTDVNVWIGANRQPYVDYRWAEDRARFNYTNWGPKQPVSQHFFDTCVFMQVSKVLPGKWVTSRCKESLGYVCQIRPSEQIAGTTPLPVDCPTSSSGYRKYGESCFKLHASELATWDKAEDICKSEGGHLASVNNGLEENFLTSLLIHDEQQVEANTLWLGLRDTKEGVFVWSNKWPVYFTNWASGQPQNSDQSRCVFMEKYSKEWNVTSCQDERAFICKVTAETAPVIPVKPDRVCPSHVKNWTNLGTDYCYFIENGEDGYNRKTWGEALAFCMHYDASLVSFHQQHDIDILTPSIQLSGESVWTGLIKKYHGGFEWQDGSDMDFKNWDDGEPSIFNNPKCGLLNTFLKYKAEDCNRKFGFVCKIATVKNTL